MSAALPHLTEEVLASTFTNGLEEAIRKEILSLRPNGLEEMMDVALLVEERMEPGPGEADRVRSKGGRETFRSKDSGWTARTPTRAVTVASRTEAAARRKEPEVRRLTDAELKSRREKGLCYRCEERYHAGHRCKNRELRLMLLADDADDGETIDAAETEKREELVAVEETVELSLNFVIGLTTPGTI